MWGLLGGILFLLCSRCFFVLFIFNVFESVLYEWYQVIKYSSYRVFKQSSYQVIKYRTWRIKQQPPLEVFTRELIQDRRQRRQRPRDFEIQIWMERSFFTGQISTWKKVLSLHEKMD